MSTDVTTKLTESERRKFNDLDGIVLKGKETFEQVGAALSIIRDQRLYGEEWGTFEDYCAQRLGWTYRRARQLITAHEIAGQLAAETGTMVPVPECQARELAPLPPEDRAPVFAEAQAEAKAEGKPVTAKRIKSVRERHMLPKPRKPKSETPEDMASAIVRAAESKKAPEPKADGGVVTPPAAVAEASSAESSAAPRASSAGSVVLFVRAMDPTALPDAGDVGGMTDEDLTTVRMMSAWCARVIGAFAIAHKGGA